MYTTLNKILKCNPPGEVWKKLLGCLGKSHADDEPLSILSVLDSNGLDDALWCLRAVEGHDWELRLYAVGCARQVEHLMTDPRSLAALAVAERFAYGNATDAALVKAWDAARDAVGALMGGTLATAQAARAASGAAWRSAGEAAKLAATFAQQCQELETREALQSAQIAKLRELCLGSIHLICQPSR